MSQSTNSHCIVRGAVFGIFAFKIILLELANV